MSVRMLRNFITARQNVFLLHRPYSNNSKDIAPYDPFYSKPQKTKQTYLEVIKKFEEQDTRRRGHVEFIYAALSRMKEFGVQKDLEVYKALVEVLPKGKLIPTNIFQAEFMHYPKQQQCAVDLLEQMEDNGVMPDTDMEQILLNTFGRRGIPLRKYWRMMYWMPKFKHLTPWHLPDELPKEALQLAILAIQRITSVDPDSNVNVWQTEEIEASLDKTWIVSSQSRMQQVLLSEQPIDVPLIIKGPYIVYLRDQTVSYFVLLGKVRAEIIDDRDVDDVSNLQKPTGIPGLAGSAGRVKLPQLKNSMHEQDDGTIVAICATGTSSRDSLLSWIRLLEKHDNPSLSTIPVMFTLLAPPSDVSLFETQLAESDEKTQ